MESERQYNSFITIEKAIKNEEKIRDGAEHMLKQIKSANLPKTEQAEAELLVQITSVNERLRELNYILSEMKRNSKEPEMSRRRKSSVKKSPVFPVGKRRSRVYAHVRSESASPSTFEVNEGEKGFAVVLSDLVSSLRDSKLAIQSKLQSLSELTAIFESTANVDRYFSLEVIFQTYIILTLACKCVLLLAHLRFEPRHFVHIDTY